METPQTSWKAVQAERQGRVRRVCKEYRNLLSGPIFIRLFVHSRKNKLLWCQNLKVGTNKTERKRIMMYFRTRLSDLRFLDDEKYTSFSIVRHPFEHLVSAYNDFSHLKKRGKRYKKMSLINLPEIS